MAPRTRIKRTYDEPERLREERAAPQPGGALSVEQVRALQRTAGNAATARLLRFSRVSDPGKPRSNGKYRLSASGHYLVQPNEKRMWVHSSVATPRSCADTGQLHPASNDYRECAPSMGFLADCLHTAEEVVHGKALAQGGDNTKVAVTGDTFGLGEKENIKAAKDYQKTTTATFGGKAPVNDGAAPGPGQAFVIVDTTPKSNKAAFRYPYHAAGVIARDGDDAVTMEMFASDSDAMDTDRGTEAPSFQMYGPEATFHSTWSSYYATPITIVIEAL